MVFYENGKRVRYNPGDMNYDKKIGTGEEGIVYLINDMAVKFYKRGCWKVRLDKQTVEKMTKIKTRRILLPRVVLLNKKRKLMGYKTEFIEDKGIDSFFKLEKEKLKEQMKIINEDINILSDNNILVEDLIPPNTVYNNGLYLVDPGSFKFEDERVCIEGENRDRLDYYFYLLFRTYCRRKYKADAYSPPLMYIRKNICNGGWHFFNYLMNEFEYENLEEMFEEAYQKVKCK